MPFLYDTIVVLHFIGLASLLGGFLVQLKTSPRAINPAMFHGVLTQLVTGILMVGMRYPLHDADPNVWGLPDNAKIGVKLLITLIVAVLVITNRKKPEVTNAVWGAIGGLTVLNIAIAVFW